MQLWCNACEQWKDRDTVRIACDLVHPGEILARWSLRRCGIITLQPSQSIGNICMRTYADLKSTFDGRPMPFAFVDLDALDANIESIVKRAGDKQIRIASKSVRSRPILDHLLKAHSQIQGLMCFTVPEAVWLSQQGYDDLLLGYPSWHPAEIRAVCVEVRNGKTIILMIDSVAHIDHLQAIAASQDVVLPVCLDVAMSVAFPGLHFGVWRSSVTTVDHARDICTAIEHCPNITLDGIMGYEAQIADRR